MILLILFMLKITKKITYEIKQIAQSFVLTSLLDIQTVMLSSNRQRILANLQKMLKS